MDPIRYLMTLPVLLGRLAKWAIILMEYDITYVPQKAIKGQAIADFLAAYPIPDDSPLNYDLPDEHVMYTEGQPFIWKMYFDGASSVDTNSSSQVLRIKVGAGIVFVTPSGGIIQHSISISEP